MKPETLVALKGSIIKWEGIVAGTTRDEGGDNCPLCLRFSHGFCLRHEDNNNEEHCPVKIRSGRSWCEDTPYQQWMNLFYGQQESMTWKADTIERIAAAQNELDFLRSLLPTEEQT